MPNSVILPPFHREIKDMGATAAVGMSQVIYTLPTQSLYEQAQVLLMLQGASFKPMKSRHSSIIVIKQPNGTWV